MIAGCYYEFSKMEGFSLSFYLSYDYPQVMTHTIIKAQSASLALEGEIERSIRKMRLY